MFTLLSLAELERPAHWAPKFEGGRNLDVEIFADAETPMVGDQKADPPTYAA